MSISILCCNGMKVSTQLRPTETAVHSNWNTALFLEYFMINIAQKLSIRNFKNLVRKLIGNLSRGEYRHDIVA
jgi:hypothetical protein